MRWRATCIGGRHIPDDGELLDDNGVACARVRAVDHGPMRGTWWWGWQRFPAEQGYAPDKAAAKAECERRAVAQLHCSPIAAEVKSTT